MQVIMTPEIANGPLAVRSKTEMTAAFQFSANGICILGRERSRGLGIFGQPAGQCLDRSDGARVSSKTLPFVGFQDSCLPWMLLLCMKQQMEPRTGNKLLEHVGGNSMVYLRRQVVQFNTCINEWGIDCLRGGCVCSGLVGLVLWICGCILAPLAAF